MNPLEILKGRVSALGNHYQKYIFTIEKHKDSLIKALESSGKIMQIHLWRSSFSPAEEMKIISNLSRDTKQRVEHLSCYYALQYLYMIFRNLDILALGTASEASSIEIYHQFMMNIGHNFRDLSSAYIENLLKTYLPRHKQPDFFLCSVGTRADQDDIDVGIITTEEADVKELNEAFRKITQNMLVYATPLHLYLSEHVGKQVYTTTIREYDHLLSKQIQDVVILSELLNARFMLGSEGLFKSFQKQIISRYFYKQSADSRFHEGFLRGILGEARAMLISPPQNDAITPKYDAIRILKSILYAKKTINNVEEVNAWDIINALMQKEPHLQSEYELLFRAISFLEMFKFMMQLFVIQEDKFRLEEIDQTQLTLIAEKMGYRHIGMVSAWDQLIIDYYKFVKEVRKLSDFLLADTSRHLRKISIFIKMFKAPEYRDKAGGYRGSLTKDVIYQARFFWGTKYWEDVLDQFENKPGLVEEFIGGFEILSEPVRKVVVRNYVGLAEHTQITVIKLLTILGKKQQTMIGDTVYKRFNQEYLRYIYRLPGTLERLCRIFSHYPQYVHEYLQVLPESHYDLMHKILSGSVMDDELKEFHVQLLDLFNVHRLSSRYFHRFFYRIILNHPEYLKSLNNTAQMYKISSGLLAMVDSYPNTIRKKKVLGDYYDLEFLRLGIGTMRGAELEITNREFTEFCDNYLQKLFDICTEEIEREWASSLPSSDTFAILAAGGHARGQAYDDDYDLIAIVDTDDENVIRHANQVVARMNREILKRGLLPHYRIGEILGGFVSPISQITEYLDSDQDESFIDLSQLLGARMIIGSEVMESVICDKILDRFVYKRKTYYIKRMIHEILNRQEVMGRFETGICNIKETTGGLRDIEAITLMLKAALEKNIPLSANFLSEMKIYFPDIAKTIDMVLQSRYTLRTMRNLYRITEAAEDHINRNHLSRLAYVFKKNNRPEWGSSELIYESLKEKLDQSATACLNIVEFLEKKFT